MGSVCRQHAWAAGNVTQVEANAGGGGCGWRWLVMQTMWVTGSADNMGGQRCGRHGWLAMCVANHNTGGGGWRGHGWRQVERMTGVACDGGDGGGR